MCDNAKHNSGCASPSDCYAENIRKVYRCIGLLNSMVQGGEQHSDASAQMTAEALDALECIEQQKRKEPRQMNDNRTWEIPLGAVPPVPSKPLLSTEVMQLEQIHEELRLFCGTVLATLNVNRERGTLHCDDPAHTAKFDELLASWWAHYDSLDNNILPIKEAK